jgi:hypothetical protein
MDEPYPDCPEKRGRSIPFCENRICIDECEKNQHNSDEDCFEECRLCEREQEDHDNNSCRSECDICREERNEQGEAMEPFEHYIQVDKFLMKELRKMTF